MINLPERAMRDEENNLNDLKAFVLPFYQIRDSMHNLAHVERLHANAIWLGRSKNYDPQVLAFAAYFHGVGSSHWSTLQAYMQRVGVSEVVQKCIWTAVEESMADATPVSLEGILLHDAHLIEGGTSFLITKSLITGAERGQTLEESIDYLQTHILGKRRCVLPEAQAYYEKMEAYARQHIAKLHR